MRSGNELLFNSGARINVKLHHNDHQKSFLRMSPLVVWRKEIIIKKGSIVRVESRKWNNILLCKEQYREHTIDSHMFPMGWAPLFTLGATSEKKNPKEKKNQKNRIEEHVC